MDMPETQHRDANHLLFSFTTVFAPDRGASFSY
jgi:hypothetical protein